MRLLLGVYKYIYIFFLVQFVCYSSDMLLPYNFSYFLTQKKLNIFMICLLWIVLLFLVLKKQIFHLIASADFHSWCFAFSLAFPHDPYYGSLMS